MDNYSLILEDNEKSLALSRVVAHLMGDGHINGRYLRYNNKEEFLLKHFKEDMNLLFPNLHFIKGKVNSGTSFIQVQNKSTILFLNSLAQDFRSHMLKMPLFVNKRDLKVEFLKAIYDDEGCVSLRVFKKTNELKRNLEIGSKSKEFLFEIKNILENDFEIKTNKLISYSRILNGKPFTTWKLSITGKINIEKFKKNIGFYHPTKKNKLELMINSYKRKDRKA